MKLRPRTRPTPATADAVALIADMTFELVPIGSAADAVAALPPVTNVSVTCSPVKGIAATQALTAELLERGHRPVPHLAARMVTDREHVRSIAAWLRANELREAFVIAGDAIAANGPFPDAVSFLRELQEHDTGLTRVGVAAYPDGHPHIPDARLAEALLAKQELLSAAGVAATATTQMCFDDTVAHWLRSQRAGGPTMPVDLGIPGVVDRTRLLSMGVRLGVGASLRFARKHRATMAAMIGRYDPTALVDQLVAATTGLGVTGLHCFTFNSVATTVTWQRDIVVGDGA